MKKTSFINLFCQSFDKEALKKIIFSRPEGSEIKKVSGRLCMHRGRPILALEYSLPGNTVSHKNLPLDEAEGEVEGLLSIYKQANLLTTFGDVEWKISKSGKEALLGADTLKRRLSGDAPAFESAIESLDRKKNYILSGSESFLIELGISDSTGRIHDKKQGKYRQINRFLENIEDIYSSLKSDGELIVYDLCCGKSYLSFAVYYYLTAVKGRDVSMLCIDLKRDVIKWCDELAARLNFSGMRFVCDDVKNTPQDVKPDMVISLHACDVATDIVIDEAIKLGAGVILSTPCCHRYLNDKIKSPALEFVTDNAHLKTKLCEALTDSIRVERLRMNGYSTVATELTDPENTPKNTLIRAIYTGKRTGEERYNAILDFLLGDGKNDYLKEIK